MKNNLSENEMKVLVFLQNNAEMTVRQAVIALDINNVYDVIMRLRNYGYNIPRAWKTSKSQKRYGAYTLIQ